MQTILEYIKKTKTTEYSIPKFKTFGELLDSVKSLGYVENNIAKTYFDKTGVTDSKFSKHLTGLSDSYMCTRIGQFFVMALYRNDADIYLWIYTDDNGCDIDGATIFHKSATTLPLKYIKRDDAIKYISDYINGSI